MKHENGKTRNGTCEGARHYKARLEAMKP